jgi:hypothetical protein
MMQGRKQTKLWENQQGYLGTLRSFMSGTGNNAVSSNASEQIRSSKSSNIG